MHVHTDTGTWTHIGEITQLCVLLWQSQEIYSACVRQGCLIPLLVIDCRLLQLEENCGSCELVTCYMSGHQGSLRGGQECWVVLNPNILWVYLSILILSPVASRSIGYANGICTCTFYTCISPNACSHAMVISNTLSLSLILSLVDSPLSGVGYANGN